MGSGMAIVQGCCYSKEAQHQYLHALYAGPPQESEKEADDAAVAEPAEQVDPSAG